MFLRHLELQHFRNYAHLSLTFHRGLNILYGENAQGKTNLLEAILFLALARSPRANRDAELVEWQHPWARIRGEVVRRARQDAEVDISLYASGRKVVKVNGILRRRMAEVLGEVSVVLFSPQDIDMVKGEPSLRRRFLNLALNQTSPEYYSKLTQYRRVLAQRNRLLRQAGDRPIKPEWLAPWTQQMIDYGSFITYARLQALQAMGEWAGVAHAHLSGQRETLEVRYQPSIPVGDNPSEEEVRVTFQATLARLSGEEQQRRTSLVGPHRDDIALRIGGMEIRAFGSQGQQRTAALALKLAELHWLQQKGGETPLLLLDDVMSELDDERRRRVMDLTAEADQIHITCAQQSTFSEAILRRAGVFQVAHGTLTEVQSEC